MRKEIFRDNVKENTSYDNDSLRLPLRAAVENFTSFCEKSIIHRDKDDRTKTLFFFVNFKTNQKSLRLPQKKRELKRSNKTFSS